MVDVPKIDSHEAANLEMMFQGFKDRELIRELVRRGRLHVVDYNDQLYKEMVNHEDSRDSYIAHKRRLLVDAIGTELVDKGHVIITQSDSPDPLFVHRRGTVVVLRERGVKPDGL